MATLEPYDGMTDKQLLIRAAEALKKVQQLPIRSAARSKQWAVYEDAKAELDIRMMRHILQRLEERGELWPL